MAIFVDDPDVLALVKQLADLLRCSEEEAIGHAVTSACEERISARPDRPVADPND